MCERPPKKSKYSTVVLSRTLPAILLVGENPQTSLEYVGFFLRTGFADRFVTM